MREWRDIEKDPPPTDGTPFQARIPGHGEDNIIAWTDGLVGEDEEPCGSWYFVEDQEPPDCWTDGVCWAENADGKPSVKPTHWKPLPRTGTERDSVFGRVIPPGGETQAPEK